MSSVQRKLRRARWAAWAGLAVSIACALVYLGVTRVGALGRMDARLFVQFGQLDGKAHVNALASLFASLCDPGAYDYLVAVPVIVTLLRRRLLLTGALLVMILGAIVTAEALKPALTAMHAGLLSGGPNLKGSWPSGHSTAATALSLALVLAAPPRLRPSAAVLGAAFAGAVIYSVLVLGWHYPSDALGGIGVATAWGCATISVVSRIEARRAALRPEQPATAGLSPTKRATSLSAALTPPVLAALTVLAGVLALLLLRPAATIDYVRSHHAMVVAIAGLGALSIAAATAVALAVRR